MSKQYTIFVGNPGTGKSTLLNGLCPGAHFQSGISFGAGLTQKLQLAQITNTEFFGDTPGLSDIANRKSAAKEIENGLKQNGEYRLIFVITLEAGRVRPDDAITIKLILESINLQVPYAVIINKLEERVLAKLNENFDASKKSISVGLLNEAPFVTELFHPIIKVREIDGEDNAAPPQHIVNELRQFLDTVPFISVAPPDVSEINTDEYQQLTEQLQSKIEELNSNIHKMETRYHELLQRAEEDRKALVEALNRPPVVVHSGGGGRRCIIS